MREPGWITKAEAAALNHCDPRTIERKAAAGKIASTARPGFPTLYWQADVEKLQQTGTGEVRTGVLEPGPAGNGNGSHTSDVSNAQIARVPDPVHQLCALLVQLLTAGPIGPTGPTGGPTGPTPPTVYVTVQEAAAILGLPQVDVRRLVDEGDLKARLTGRGGMRIRRKDLEAL